jgi:hypothetical protein
MREVGGGGCSLGEPVRQEETFNIFKYVLKHNFFMFI